MIENDHRRNQGEHEPQQHTRDPRLDAVQTASGAVSSKAGTDEASPRTNKDVARSGLARKITGIAAMLLIAFCSWSLVIYLQGGDPLLALSGQATQEIAAGGSGASSSGTTSTSSKASSVGSSEGSSADDSAESSSDNSTSSSDSNASPSNQQSGSDKSGKSASSSSSSNSAASGASSSSSSSSSSNASSSSASSGTSGTSSSSGTSAAPSQPTQSNTITVSVSAGGSSSRLTLSKGATAYDALLALGVGVNAENTQYGIYVTAINGVAADANHGWTYKVNGVMPNVSAGSYTLSDEDSVVWTYVTVN